MHRSSSGRALLGLAALALAVFALALPSLVRAQSGTTSLRGTVIDKSGAAIVGANVALTNAAQSSSARPKPRAPAPTSFRLCRPGSYVLTIEMPASAAMSAKIFSCSSIRRPPPT